MLRLLISVPSDLVPSRVRYYSNTHGFRLVSRFGHWERGDPSHPCW